jgi:hypothetical protein
MAYHQKKEKEDKKKKKETSMNPFPLEKINDNLEVQNYQHILN